MNDMKATNFLTRSVRALTLASALLVPGALMVSAPVVAAPQTFVLDTEGAHAFIQFKIKHLGFSWLWGRFDTFNGTFTVDEDQIENSSVNATIQVASLNTNHAERDKHLRSSDFFDAQQFPTATFTSTRVERTGELTANIHGNLTLKGVTRPVILKATYIGSGKDPWGGFRAGFEASTEIELKDFNINYDLGPASTSAEVLISVEGVRK